MLATPPGTSGGADAGIYQTGGYLCIFGRRPDPIPVLYKVDISLSVSVLHINIVSQAIVQDGNVRSYRIRVLRPGIGIQS
jgi:hypothetical protein